MAGCTRGKAMSREEGLALADEVMDELRKLSYGECRQLIGAVSRRELRGRDGIEYRVAIEAFWDGRENGNIRVMVMVDDGGLSAFKPWCRDFIIAPDGSFVGEG
jgi:hypothetical protein